MTIKNKKHNKKRFGNNLLNLLKIAAQNPLNFTTGIINLQHLTTTGYTNAARSLIYNYTFKMTIENTIMKSNFNTR